MCTMRYAICAGAVALGVLAVPDLPDVRWSALSAGFWLNVVCPAVGAAAANLHYYRGVAAVGPASASLPRKYGPGSRVVGRGVRRLHSSTGEPGGRLSLRTGSAARAR